MKTIYFVDLYLSKEVHAQALGFTKHTMHFVSADSEDEAVEAAKNWLEAKSKDQGYPVQVLRGKAEKAINQDLNSYTFPEQIIGINDWLIEQLGGFSDLTVARMAIKDLRNGDLNVAMQRLKVDSDKMRDSVHQELYKFIVNY